MSAMSTSARVRAAGARDRRQPINVLWLTSGLGCDGDSVAMTAATNPSLEDLLRGCLPGDAAAHPLQPGARLRERRRLHARVVRRRRRPARPVHPRARGLGPERGDQRRRALGGARRRPRHRPADPHLHVDRPARAAGRGGARARHVRRLRRDSRRCATTRPARWGCATTSAGAGRRRLGIPIVNLPGCPVAARQHHRDAAAASCCTSPASGPTLELDEQGRPASRSSAAPSTRAATAPAWPSTGQFSDGHGDGRCLVKLGCKGPVVKCNVPIRGWVNGVGGCPNVGGICMACTMPGFPDKYMPFMEADAAAPAVRPRPRDSPTARSSGTCASAASAGRSTSSRTGGAAGRS